MKNQKKRGSEYLSDLRLSAGMSYRSLASESGVSASYLHQLEHDVIKEPLPTTLFRVANALDSSVDDMCHNFGVLPCDVATFISGNTKLVTEVVRNLDNSTNKVDKVP